MEPDRQFHSLLIPSRLYKRVYCAKEYRKWNRFPVYLLAFIEQGSGQLTVNGTPAAIHSGDIVFVIPGLSVELASSNPLTLFVVTLECLGTAGANRRLLQQTMPAETGLAPGRLPVAQHNIIERIRQLYSDSRERPPCGSLPLHARLLELISGLQADCLLRTSQSDSNDGLTRSILYIEKHFDRPLNLAKLSDIAGLTPNSYCRAFKKMTGHSPMDYVSRIRIDKAKALLSQGNFPVKQVAASVGFDNEFHFSRTFKKNVGISPRLYSRRSALRIAVASCMRLQDNLISLGMESFHYLDAYLYPGMEIADHRQRLSLQLQQLAQFKPDLILCDLYHDCYLEMFNELAPTVLLPRHKDWRSRHRLVAELVGRKQEGEHSIQEADAAAEQFRSMKEKADTSITMIQVTHKAVRIQGVHSHPLNELLYRDLAMKPGSGVPLHIGRVEYLPEQLPTLNTELLLLHKHHVAAGSESMFNRMRQSPAWKLIDAVRDNKVQLIPNWLVMSWSPWGRKQIMEQLHLALGKAKN